MNSLPWIKPKNSQASEIAIHFLPLPKGEGRDEGEGNIVSSCVSKAPSPFAATFKEFKIVARSAIALIVLAGATVRADSPITFGGVPVNLKISEIDDRTVRIELKPVAADNPAPPSWTLAEFPAKERFHAIELAADKKLRIGDLRLTIHGKPLTVTVRRADDSLVQELVFNAESGTNAVSFRTDAPVLGLGEGGDQFDRRGFNFPLINGQRYKLAELGARAYSPFLIGTEGWGMFAASPRASFDLRGERGSLNPQNGTPGYADIFVIDAREPADALREFIRLTGAPVMPPKWALGYMQSHRTLSTEADILQEARTFREKELPCDTVIYLGTGFCPAGWNFGHDSFEFNTNVFVRDAASVIHDLHSNHLHVILHIVPLQRDYPSLHGHIPPAPGETVDKQHIANYWNRHHDLVAAGVDGWWPDEGDWLDEPSRLARHRMYYEGPLSSTPDERPWNLQRNGAPGMAQFAGWIWSGDINSSWNTFAAQVNVGINSSLSLSPYWGTDIGGFYPSTNHDFTGELYARWFEFAAFCPSFRSHGRTWHLHTPWGWNTGETGPVESRPAPDASELHNGEVEPVCKKYLDLRYQLMPYTYTITREARDTGVPLMRALWLHYPKDPEAVKLGSEYLWGRDLLIAPVTEKAAKSRRVYLPAGGWFDWWTSEKTSGKQWIDRPVDLATMPIYVRAGSIIPVDPVRQYISEPVSAPTTLKVYPGADGEFTLYDDDGESPRYLKGSDPKTIWIHLKWNDARHRLTIEPDSRMKKWPGGVRSFVIEQIGSSAKPKPIDFSGKRVEVSF
jgi:alpha-glucosidase (family GH31 glycosyl hydrolase)